MADAETEAKKEDGEGEKKFGQYPLIRMTDLPNETKPEIVEMISTTVERNSLDLQNACKLIKEHMDKTYGSSWNVIIGEAFGFEVSYLKRHLLYMFTLGTLGVLVWKCG
ncbi:unnamed protein product [Orchesella dallaii]|uniref:Dynein light chain n=1 Tax=Orchesella dallaii TaxID=48710 RepID=A0ABP1RA88_9HEXA